MCAGSTWTLMQEQIGHLLPRANDIWHLIKRRQQAQSCHLRGSHFKLSSCLVAGAGKCLCLPEGFYAQSLSSAQSDAAQQLYHLLELLRQLMFERDFPGVAPVNLYYDANDGCIAFNKGNELWYNAHAYADRVCEQSPLSIRLFNWYITVCHELAHNFRKEHDEVLSDYHAHIALQHSKGFYALCHRCGIEMPWASTVLESQHCWVAFTYVVRSKFNWNAKPDGIPAPKAFSMCCIQASQQQLNKWLQDKSIVTTPSATMQPI